MGNRRAVVKSVQTHSNFSPFLLVNLGEYVNLLFLIAFCLFPKTFLLVRAADALLSFFEGCLFSQF